MRNNFGKQLILLRKPWLSLYSRQRYFLYGIIMTDLIEEKKSKRIIIFLSLELLILLILPLPFLNLNIIYVLTATLIMLLSKYLRKEKWSFYGFKSINSSVPTIINQDSFPQIPAFINKSTVFVVVLVNIMSFSVIKYNQ